MNQIFKWLISATAIQLMFVSLILSNDKNAINIKYQSDDGAYILFWDCNYRTNSPTLYINITSVTGGSGNYTIIPANNTFVSQNKISEGEGFTFYFTTTAQVDDNVTFLITDTQGNSREIDFYIETQLYYLNFGNCADEDYYCKENIAHHQGMVPVSDHSAKGTIFSSGTVQATTDINYYAGQTIDLQPGFEVKSNATFLATIKGCPNP